MRYDYNEICQLVTDKPKTTSEIALEFYHENWIDFGKRQHVGKVLKSLQDDGQILAYASCGKHGRLNKYVVNHGQTVHDEPMITVQMVNLLKKEQRWISTDELIHTFYDESRCTHKFRDTVNRRLRKMSVKEPLEHDKFSDQTHWRAVV